jgi:iron complex transport system substrate-binding protein
MFGSWCGKKFRAEQVCARPGWDVLPAVRNGQLFEIKSPVILQPGPAAILEGLPQMQAHIARWVAQTLTLVSVGTPQSQA